MAYTTSQQLNKYYSLYKNINVTFSKEVMMAINFEPRQTFVRCSGGQWPCIVNSVSMLEAKILCGTNSGFIEKLREGAGSISIRLTFFQPEVKGLLSFFVSAKLKGISEYEASGNKLVLISLEYTQRAPDDLIEKLGSLIEANIASKKRREERILLNDENRRKIALEKTESVIFIDGIPRRCILRDLSFSGVKVLMVGVANFLKDKDVTVRFSFEDPVSTFGIKGRIVRTENVAGRKDLIAIAINYHDETIPMLYKMYLNRYFSVSHLKNKGAFEETESNDSWPGDD